MPVLLIVVLGFPLLELWLAIEVGRQIGALTTVLLVMGTALAGFALLRAQGYIAIQRAREKAASGQLPVRELAEGVFFAVSGLLLLTPGFISDAIGLLCLIPGLRSLVAAWFLTKIPVVQMRRQGPSNDPGATYEGEFHRESESDRRLK